MNKFRNLFFKFKPMSKKHIIFLLLIVFHTSIYSQINEYDDLYIKANIEFEAKNYQEAISLLNKAILLNENDSKLYFKLGESFQASEDYTNALEVYSKCLKLKEDLAFLKIAESYAETGASQKSVEYLNEYLKTRNKLFESEIKLNPSFIKIENSKEWKDLYGNDEIEQLKTEMTEILMVKLGTMSCHVPNM